MSVYSGFSTRQQESQYYKLIESLLSLLQTRVLFCLKTYKRADDSNWSKRFISTYNTLKSLESHKYLDPKLSLSCSDLANYFAIDKKPKSMLADYNFPQLPTHEFYSPTKGMVTPKKRISAVRGRIFEESSKKSASKSGMSKYYGKIMDNFLAKPKSVSRDKHKSKGTFSMDSQDFWLLDDRIRVIDKDRHY